MAKEQIQSEEAMDFGIVDTSSMLGNLKAVDAFLSGEASKAGKSEDLEEIEEGAEGGGGEEDDEEAKAEAAKKAALAKKAAQQAAGTKKPAVAAKKPEAPKPSAEDILFGKSGVEEEEEEQGEDGKEEGKKEIEEGNGEEDGGVKGNPYEDLSKDLVKLGVFLQTDENEPLPKTGEEFLNKFNAEKQRGAAEWLDSFLSQHGEDRRELFDAIFVNGVDPSEYLPIYSSIQNLDSLDLTKEENQEIVQREFYRRQKMAPDKIEARIQKSKDFGFLEEDAKDFQQQLIAQDTEALNRQKAEKANKLAAEAQADQAYKASLVKIISEAQKAKEYKGFPVNEATARAAFDFLYTKKYKTADGQLLTEFDKFILETKRPENHEQRVLLALIKQANFDFSKIAKRAVSKESNELFASLAQKKSKEGATTAIKSTASKSWMEL